MDPKPTPRELESKLRNLVEDVVEAEGYVLTAVLLVTVEGRRTVRIAIDKPGGVNLDDCTRVNRLLSPLLDAEDPISCAYDLEVSSPGMDRPVQRREDFERFEGYRIRVRLSKGAGVGRNRLTGTLRGVVEDKVLIEAEGTVHSVPLAAIERAQLVLDMEEYRRISGIVISESGL